MFRTIIRKIFVDKLGSFDLDISETRQILLDDVNFPLESHAPAIKDILQELDGQRTVGLASYRHDDTVTSSPLCCPPWERLLLQDQRVRAGCHAL